MKLSVLSIAVLIALSIVASGQEPLALCQSQIMASKLEAAVASCTEAAKIDPKAGFTAQGMANVGLGKWVEAVRSFSLAMEAGLNTAELYFSRGNAYFSSGEFKAAAEDFSRASTMEPRMAARIKPQLDAAREIAELLPVKKVSPAIERKSLDASLAANSLLIQRALKVSNKVPKEEIDALDRQVTEKIDEAIRVNKYSPHAYSTRAIFYDAQGRSAKAIVEYTKAIALDPKSAPTIFSRGQLFAKMKTYLLAISDFSKAIEIDYNVGAYTSVYYSARAEAYEKTGQKDKALQDLTYMVETKPKDAFGYELRAELYLRMKDNTKALADLNKAVELDPKGASGRLSRCRYYNDAKNYAAAVADCTVSAEQKSLIISDSAMYERAIAYTGLKKYDLALADLAKAEASGMISKADLFAQRGIIFTRQGKKTEAAVAFNAALKEDPKNQKALDGLKAIN